MADPRSVHTAGKPPRRLWMHAVNRIARTLAVPKATLDATKLRQRAIRATSLENFGDPSHGEPLEILLAALEDEAALNPLGRWMASTDIGRFLRNRLLVEAALDRVGPAEGEPRQPIFVTGPGRSGTSILHELMALDPNLRPLRDWEAWCPGAPPDASTSWDADRIREADRTIRLWNAAAPAYRTMHEGGAESPQECGYLYANAFQSEIFTGFHRIPTYAKWLMKSDMRIGLGYHKRCLRALALRRPTERWTLKAPSHIGHLPALFAVYPDALVVQTHRDPLKVMASMTSLLATLQSMRSDDVAPARLGKGFVRGNAALLNEALRQRREGVVPDDRFRDVLYADFMKDPAGRVEALYEELGLVWTHEHGDRIRSYLANKPQDRGHGRHSYRFEDTGLDAESERAHFVDYQAHFGVPNEPL
ncbi:MAG: sulfotransferase [Myxococcota bacterium]|nr:sulfotransferase [Myxococcota bacterium]